MFRKLVEEIRLEFRSGPYGHYNVRGPGSHFRRLLGGFGKLGSGLVGVGSLGTVSVGDHPGTERDAAMRRKAEHAAERNRKRAAADAERDADAKAKLASKKSPPKAPGTGGDIHD